MAHISFIYEEDHIDVPDYLAIEHGFQKGQTVVFEETVDCRTDEKGFHVFMIFSDSCVNSQYMKLKNIIQIEEDGILKIPELLIQKYNLVNGDRVLIKEIHDKYSDMYGVSITPEDSQ